MSQLKIPMRYDSSRGFYGLVTLRFIYHIVVSSLQKQGLGERKRAFAWYQGLQSSKRDNQLKTWILIVLLPVFLGAGVFAVFYFLNTKNGNSGTQALNLALSDTGEILTLLVPILVVWLLISFFFQKSLMFSFSGAKEVTRKEEPEIYNIVENLCISRGLPTPKI